MCFAWRTFVLRVEGWAEVLGRVIVPYMCSSADVRRSFLVCVAYLVEYDSVVVLLLTWKSLVAL